VRGGRGTQGVASWRRGGGFGRGVGGWPRTGRTRPKGGFARAARGRDDAASHGRAANRQAAGGGRRFSVVAQGAGARERALECRCPILIRTGYV
jgi:hypothetical protein